MPGSLRTTSSREKDNRWSKTKLEIELWKNFVYTHTSKQRHEELFPSYSKETVLAQSYDVTLVTGRIMISETNLWLLTHPSFGGRELDGQLEDLHGHSPNN